METITPANQGERTITWGEMQRRTNNLANNPLASGVEPGDKIAFYMRNCPKYSGRYQRELQGVPDSRQRQLSVH